MSVCGLIISRTRPTQFQWGWDSAGVLLGTQRSAELSVNPRVGLEEININKFAAILNCTERWSCESLSACQDTLRPSPFVRSQKYHIYDSAQFPFMSIISLSPSSFKRSVWFSDGFKSGPKEAMASTPCWYRNCYISSVWCCNLPQASCTEPAHSITPCASCVTAQQVLVCQ